VGAEGR
jgi:chromosome segregation ATPase